MELMGSAKVRMIVDETIFIYATRRDDSEGILSQLALFLGQSDPYKKGSKYSLYLTNISAKRLGMYSLYNFWRKYFCWKQERRKMFAKRRERKIVARATISRYFLRLFVHGAFFRRRLSSWEIMDLHLFANEMKRQNLGQPMETEEVISLDTCHIAKIAHDKNIPILSFNTDFKYFCILPNMKKPYIDYIDAVDFFEKFEPIK